VFIRKKRNNSGSISVQIVQKVNRKNKVLKSIGVGKTDLEVDLLVRLASFEVEKLKSQSSLFTYSDDLAVDAFMCTLHNEDIRLVGPSLVFGKLFYLFDYHEVLNDSTYLEALVISRIVMPGSKLRTVEYLQRHSKINVGVHAIYKYMDKHNDSIIERILDLTFTHTQDILDGEIGLLFYDMTTLYFEAEKEDELRRIGYSKDGKHQHPQIMIGLLVSTSGYPLAYQIFEGNTAEAKTLIPVVENICKRYQIDHPTVVADAALLSKNNLEKLEKKA